MLRALPALLPVLLALRSTEASERGLKYVNWGMRNEVWEEPLTTPLLANITRAEVMQRAQSWVDAKIPYCQCAGGPATECCGSCPHCATYRCDCSGYVSYCWNLGTGYTTISLPEVSHRITKDELKPGDVMLNTGDHVVLFGGWADAGKTKYKALQEPGCHTEGPHYAYESVVPYPFNFDPDLFLPYRFNHIVD
jgi:hypothetical protein